MKRKFVFICCLLLCSLVFTMTAYAAGPSDGATLFFSLEPERDFYFIYNDGTIDNNSVSGATYEKDTNTLTIKDVKGHYELAIEDMGDLTINVIGTNELLDVWIDDSYHDDSVTFTGDGTLVLNKDKEENIVPIYSRGAGRLIFEDKISLKLYSVKPDDSDNAPVIICDSMDTDSTSCITFKGVNVPEVIKERDTAMSSSFTFKAFGMIPEEFMSYKIAVKDSKKYAYSVDGDGKVKLFHTELLLDPYSNKWFIGNDDLEDINDKRTNYNSLSDLTDAGYDVTTFASDKAYCGWYQNYYVYLKDNDDNEYGLNDDYDMKQLSNLSDGLLYKVTDKKITIGDEEIPYMEYVDNVSIDTLTVSYQTVLLDTYTHYVDGPELILDRVVKKETKNPKTSDTVLNYLVISIISSVGLIILFKNKKLA